MFQRLLAAPAILVATLAVFLTAVPAQSQGHKFRIPLKKARLPVGMVQGRVTDRTGAAINAVVSIEEAEGNPPESVAVPLARMARKYRQSGPMSHE